MNYNEMTAAQCADWLAEKDGWLFNRTVSHWESSTTSKAIRQHPYSISTPDIKSPWRLVRIEVDASGKNTVTIYNGFTNRWVSVEGHDRMTAEYRAAVASRMEESQ